MKNALTFLVLGAALSACGGGSDGGTPEAPAKPPVVVTPPVVPADSVTVASETVAKEAGLNVIAGASADESVYDVAADIGDTWRITFDSVKKTYAIRVLSTQFGLSDRSGTFSATTTGNLTTYTATDFSVTVDARTRLLSGNIKLGSMVSTVSGTGYAVGDVARLAWAATACEATVTASATGVTGGVTTTGGVTGATGVSLLLPPPQAVRAAPSRTMERAFFIVVFQERGKATRNSRNGNSDASPGAQRLLWNNCSMD